MFTGGRFRIAFHQQIYFCRRKEAGLTIAILLAVATALAWGASDYFGGDSSRHETPVFVVLAIVQAAGLAILVPVLIGRGIAPPINDRLLLAAIAGAAVTVELGVVYAGLSRGDTFIGAPTGALGAAIAVVAGLIGGDPIGPALALGLVCALVGGGISAWASPSGDAKAGWRTAASVLVASIAVGTMLVTLNGAGQVDPYWAIAVEGLSTLVTATAVAWIARRARPRARPGRPRVTFPARRRWPMLVLVGTLGVAGDLAYAAAARHGALSIISAISSLYPIPTIALGRLLRGRPATILQLIGAALALAGAAVLGATSG
jgi:drug/metabolite transporter (DMT)-like permease